MGLFGLSVLLFHGLSTKLVEGSGIDVYFKDSISESQIRAFENTCKTEPWCLKTKFISREEGIKEMGKLNDEELQNFVEVTAIPLSVELYFKAESAEPDQIANVARKLEANPIVESVDYPKNVLESVSATMRRVQYTLLGLSVIFIIVAIGLINSSTRLSVFANRFIIKSMQLVGATNGFIIRPIIGKFVTYAIIAWPVSILLIAGLLYILPLIWPFAPGIEYVKEIVNPALLAIVGLLILIFGIILSVFSAWYSTRKYLRTKIENLY